MPEVVVAVVATAGGGALAAGMGLAVGTFAYAAVSAMGATAISSVLGGALGLNKRPKSPAFTTAATDRQQMIRSAVATRQIVYGQCVVSGPIVFASSSGTDNLYLHLVIPLAGHEVESIDDLWFGEEKVGALDVDGNVTDGRFAGWMRIKKHLGTADQLADADLDSESTGWTADHRLRGIAYIYVRLKWDKEQKVYPYGLENIKALVKGKKLYDPRTSTTAWSDNWALCMRDYLASSYGLRATDDEIDDNAIIAAANLSDESVTKPDATTEARYTCNGTVDTGSTPMSNLQALLTAGAGRLIYTQGLYVLQGGAYATPTITLTEDDLRGPLAVRARTARQDLVNRVRGTYVSPDNFWQPSDFPAIGNSTYETQDGGEQITKDIELPYTISTFTAQRLAKIALERGRQGIVVRMPCKLTAFKVRAGDYVYLSIAQLGWSSKPFSVTTWRMSPDGGIDLELREEAAATYSWSSGEATVVDPAPDTSLPSLTYVAPPTALVAYSGSMHQLDASGVKVCRLYCEWTHTVDSQATHYELQWKLSTDTEWSSAVVSASTRTAYIAPVQSGLAYDVRVRAVNVRGSLSAWEGPDIITASATASTISVDYADITGDKPAPGATADLSLIATGSCVITGNSVVKTGAAGWDSSVYSVESYRDGAWVSFMPSQVDKAIIVGLNQDPTTDSSYTSLDYAIQCGAAGTLFAWESGSSVSLGAGYAAGDVLSVQYDGDKVRYFQNGTVLRTSSAGPGLRFYLDSSFNHSGGQITGVRFGPLSSPRQALEAGTTVTSGGITFSAGGAIKGGQTDYNTGVGWFLGYSGGFYKFSIGDPSGSLMTWDGSTLTVTGKLQGQLIQTVKQSATADLTITTSWTTLASVTLTTQGSKTAIDVSAYEASGTLKFRIVRDSTVLQTWPNAGNLVGSNWVTHRLEDTPANGAHTYYFQALQSATTGLVQDRSIRVEDWR